MLLVEKSTKIGIYCWDRFKRSNPKYGLLFFVSVFIMEKTNQWLFIVQTCFDMLHPPCLNAF